MASLHHVGGGGGGGGVWGGEQSRSPSALNLQVGTVHLVTQPSCAMADLKTHLLRTDLV